MERVGGYWWSGVLRSQYKCGRRMGWGGVGVDMMGEGGGYCFYTPIDSL